MGILVLILLMLGGVQLFGLEYSRPLVSDVFDAIPMPYIVYNQTGFSSYSLLRDAWKESFEQPLDTPNHYWVANGTQPTVGTFWRNVTFEASFEEVASTDENPSVSLSSWLTFNNTKDLAVTVRRNETVFVELNNALNLSIARNPGFESGLDYWTQFSNGSWRSLTIEKSDLYTERGNASLRIYAETGGTTSGGEWVGVWQGKGTFEESAWTNSSLSFSGALYVSQTQSLGSAAGHVRLSYCIVLRDVSASNNVTIWYDYFLLGNPLDYVRNSTSEAHYIIKSSTETNRPYLLERNLTSDYKKSTVYSGNREVREVRAAIIFGKRSQGNVQKGGIVECSFDEVSVVKKTFRHSGHSAYLQTTYKGSQMSDHAIGGLWEPYPYFPRGPNIYVADNPSFNFSMYLNDAGKGGGNCTAFYLYAKLVFTNGTNTRNLIYIAPITVTGSPSKTHFTNTTDVKYIYNVRTISNRGIWYSSLRNVRADFENAWIQAGDFYVDKVEFGNDLYKPTGSGGYPYIKANFDGISLKIELTQEEQVMNGNLEASGWSLRRKYGVNTYTSGKTNKAFHGSSAYCFNMTGKANRVDEQLEIELDKSNFFLKATSENNIMAKGIVILIEQWSMPGSQNAGGFVFIKVTIKSHGSYYFIWYCFMLRRGNRWQTLNDANNHFYEVNATKQLETGIWYTFSRTISEDVNNARWGLTSWEVTAVSIGARFFDVDLAPSVATRLDKITILKQITGGMVYVGSPDRSQAYAYDGVWSLREYARFGSIAWAEYRSGSELQNNTYYIAFPDSLNFSAYFYAAAISTPAAVQVSLAIDDAPYGLLYDYEIIYYWGDGSGVSAMFIPDYYKIQISSTIPLKQWTHLDVNWTKDGSAHWGGFQHPRVEAVGIQVWTDAADVLDVYWDCLTFYGIWKGVKKTVRIQSLNDVWTEQCNITDQWDIPTKPKCANATHANQWYYKYWSAPRAYVENSTGTYEITANSTSAGVKIYYKNVTKWSENATDWSAKVSLNVTDFKASAYKSDLYYLNNVTLEFIILFCHPQGQFTFHNVHNAIAANDPDKYAGQLWLSYRGKYMTGEAQKDEVYHCKYA